MLPEGWTEQNLGSVIDFINGFAFKPEDWSTFGTPIIRIQNLNGSNEFNYFEGTIPEKCHVNEGDLLFCWSGSRGTSFGARKWQGPLGYLNQHIFRCVVSNKLDQSFAYFLLEGMTWQIETEAHGGGGLVHIKKSELVKFAFALPPLPEQRRIAEILGSVDAAIEATNAVIEQAKTVKQGLLQTLLTRGIGHTEYKDSQLGKIPESWEIHSLSKLTSFITSGSRGWAQYYADEGALFVRITNLKRDSIQINLEDCVYVRLPENASEGTRTRLQQNDVLISITADLGITALIDDIDGIGEAYINQHIALARPLPDKIYPAFLACYLASDFGQRQMLFLNDSGSKAGLNLGSIASLNIALPPRAEQEEIARIAREIDEMSARQKRYLTSLQVLKKGLADDLLTGKVRVPEAMGLAA